MDMGQPAASLDRSLLIVVANFPQFFAMRPVMEGLKERGRPFSLHVPQNLGDGFAEIAASVLAALRDAGHQPLTELEGDRPWQVVLEPYPQMAACPRRYSIEYQYTTISSKPDPCYLPAQNALFDAILCSNTYEHDALSVFGKTFLVGDLMSVGYVPRKQSHGDKPVLLYLPTWGQDNGIAGVASVLRELRADYYAISKSHHGTDHLVAEAAAKAHLMDGFDESYDSTTPLLQLLERADVVLSDNSACVFQCLYTGTPVAIFAADINARRLEGIDTLQHQLVRDGVIPYACAPTTIAQVLRDAVSPEQRQRQARAAADLFPADRDRVVDTVVAVLEDYLHDRVSQTYTRFHRMYAEDGQRLRREVAELSSQLAQAEQRTAPLRAQVAALTEELAGVYDSRSWRLTAPLRRLVGLLADRPALHGPSKAKGTTATPSAVR